MLSETQPLAEGSGKQPPGEKRLDKRLEWLIIQLIDARPLFGIPLDSGRDDDAKA